jgi:PhnB protein
MATATPYLFFDGNAEEAMNFYKDVFGAELSTMGFDAVVPEGDPVPPGLMHSDLWVGDFRLFASDGMPANPDYKPSPFANPEICISADASEEAAATGWFNALAESGEIEDPLEKKFWGDSFGKVTDKFGVMWMVNISAPKQDES